MAARLIGKTELMQEKLQATEHDGPSWRTILRGIKKGDFPQPVKVSPKVWKFREDEIDAWLASRRRQGGQRA